MTLLTLCFARLNAQTNAAGMLDPTAAGGFGTGAQNPLRFAGETGPQNQVSLSMGTSILFDDNVYANNADRLSDEAVSFTSHLGVSRQTENMNLTFEYAPFFLIYRQADQLDRLNHAANLNFAYRLAPRLLLGLHDSFSYQNGVNPGLTGQQINSGSLSPVGLNQFVYSPTQRVLMNTPGLDLTFAKDSRNSLTLSGSFNQRRFGSQSVGSLSLVDSKGYSGSAQYNHRITEHTSVGILLSHQDWTYEGAGLLGAPSRSQIESGHLFLRSHLSPSVTVSVYGGPQYVRSLGQSSPASGPSGNWEASGGGSITKEVRKTAINLAFERSVSDGGGLYGSVVNTNASLGVRRRLIGRWEVSFNTSAVRMLTSLQSANNRIDTLNGGIDFSRPLSNGSTVRFSYSTIHELTAGALPYLFGFDRNEVSINFDFRLKALPLGK